VVFAAGNSGPDPDTMNPYAEAPWVIAVAAGCFPQDTVHCPDGLLTDFSSRGVAGSAQFQPTLTAPGAHIVSTRAATGTTLNVLDGPHDIQQCGLVPSGLSNVGYYTCASGTSMASPHVVGVVALLQQATGGRLTPDQVKKVLTQTARPMTKDDGRPYGPWEVGAGYLDAYAAVLAVMR
jgi:serine protease AprX